MSISQICNNGIDTVHIRERLDSAICMIATLRRTTSLLTCSCCVADGWTHITTTVAGRTWRCLQREDGWENVHRWSSSSFHQTWIQIRKQTLRTDLWRASPDPEPLPTIFCRSMPLVFGNHSSLPMPLEEGSRFGNKTARLLVELRLQLRHSVET